MAHSCNILRAGISLLAYQQAQRADNPDGEVGLIPSKEFQEM